MTSEVKNYFSEAYFHTISCFSATWSSHMVFPYGRAIWQSHMARPWPYDKAIWQCHMAMPYGNAIRHCMGPGTGPGTGTRDRDQGRDQGPGTGTRDETRDRDQGQGPGTGNFNNYRPSARRRPPPKEKRSRTFVSYKLMENEYDYEM